MSAQAKLAVVWVLVSVVVVVTMGCGDSPTAPEEPCQQYVIRVDGKVVGCG